MFVFTWNDETSWPSIRLYFCQRLSLLTYIEIRRYTVISVSGYGILKWNGLQLMQRLSSMAMKCGQMPMDLSCIQFLWMGKNSATPFRQIPLTCLIVLSFSLVVPMM